MAIIAKPHTFDSGDVIIASEHNANFDALFNLVNAALDTTNFSASAAIVDTQLAQITTASKVHGSSVTGTIIFTKGSDIASATTTDIGAATGNLLDVTGTTTITGLGTVASGALRIVRFTGALLLTYNATSLILPTSANITTVAGDIGVFQSLGSGNWVCLVYQRRSGSALATSAGSVVQIVSTQTGAVATGSTQTIVDDSIPQNSEGDQYMTLAITPTSATNNLLIQVVVDMATAGADNIILALFQDSTADALAVEGFYIAAASESFVVPLNHFMAAGTTSATTFKVRIGSGGPSTLTFNGVAGVRRYGGKIASSITITEVKV